MSENARPFVPQVGGESVANVTPPEERGDDYEGPSRDELLASLKGIDVGATVPPEQAPPPVATPPAQQAPTAAAAAAPPAQEQQAATAGGEQEPENKFGALFKAWEKSREPVLDAKSEAEKIREDARRAAVEEAKAEAQKIIEAARREADEHVARFKRSPLETIRASQWKGEDVVEATRLASTKEWQELQAQRDQLASVEKGFNPIKAQLDKISAWQQQQEAREQAAARASREQELLGELGEGSALRQHLHEREILARAYEWDQRLGNPNFVASDPSLASISRLRETNWVAYRKELVQLLEYEQSRRQGTQGQELGSRPTQANGMHAAATKPKAPNGSRTLSASSVSERRAAPKPISEMTPEEQRAALAAEANAAIEAVARGG